MQRLALKERKESFHEEAESSFQVLFWDNWPGHCVHPVVIGSRGAGVLGHVLPVCVTDVTGFNFNRQRLCSQKWGCCKRSLLFWGVFGLSRNPYWLGKENLEQFWSCEHKHWEQSLLQKTPTNRLEVVRRVNKVLPHGWRIRFLFPLLLFELSIIPLPFTILVCFPFSEISGSFPGVPCTAHPITSLLASPLRKFASLHLGSTIFALHLVLSELIWACGVKIKSQ